MASDNYKEKFVEMVNANLMSSSVNPEGSDLGQSAIDHYNDAQKFLPPHFRSNPIVFGARASTLIQELIRADAPKHIGILSLDLEGGEYSALQGLNFDLYTPKYILLKSREPTKITMFMEKRGYFEYTKIRGWDYLWINSKECQ